jgi:hypothetical protein
MLTTKIEIKVFPTLSCVLGITSGETQVGPDGQDTWIKLDEMRLFAIQLKRDSNEDALI